MIPRTQNYPPVTRSQTHMEVNIGELELFQKNVVLDLNTIAQDIAQIHYDLSEIRSHNKTLVESLHWVGYHYPEVMEALKSTVDVTIALGRSNAQTESV